MKKIAVGLTTALVSFIIFIAWATVEFLQTVGDEPFDFDVFDED